MHFKGASCECPSVAIQKKPEKTLVDAKDNSKTSKHKYDQNGAEGQYGKGKGGQAGKRSACFLAHLQIEIIRVHMTIPDQFSPRYGSRENVREDERFKTPFLEMLHLQVFIQNYSAACSLDSVSKLDIFYARLLVCLLIETSQTSK